MAKISARGATKIAEYRSDRYVLALCSDGRLLVRSSEAGSTYSVMARNVTPAKLSAQLNTSTTRYRRVA